MGYIDTFETLRAKLKYGVNIRDQICNLPFSNLLKNELILLCLVATLKMMVKIIYIQLTQTYRLR